MRHPLCSNRLILAYSTPIVVARNKKNMPFHSVNELLFIYLQDKALQHEDLQAEICTLRPQMMKIPSVDDLNWELCGLFWTSKRAVRQTLKESS